MMENGLLENVMIYAEKKQPNHRRKRVEKKRSSHTYEKGMKITQKSYFEAIM